MDNTSQRVTGPSWLSNVASQIKFRIAKAKQSQTVRFVGLAGVVFIGLTGVEWLLSVFFADLNPRDAIIATATLASAVINVLTISVMLASMNHDSATTERLRQAHGEILRQAQNDKVGGQA